MSETSKAEQYRLACEAASGANPMGCEIIEMGQVVLTATVTETGKVRIITVPGTSISPDKIAQIFVPWFRDTFEPPTDDVAEIVKGLRVDEMPEVELTDEDFERIQPDIPHGRFDLRATEETIARRAYRAGAKAMWEKVRKA